MDRGTTLVEGQDVPGQRGGHVQTVFPGFFIGQADLVFCVSENIEDMEARFAEDILGGESFVPQSAEVAPDLSFRGPEVFRIECQHGDQGAAVGKSQVIHRNGMDEVAATAEGGVKKGMDAPAQNLGQDLQGVPVVIVRPGNAEAVKKIGLSHIHAVFQVDIPGKRPDPGDGCFGNGPFRDGSENAADMGFDLADSEISDNRERGVSGYETALVKLPDLGRGYGLNGVRTALDGKSIGMTLKKVLKEKSRSETDGIVLHVTDLIQEDRLFFLKALGVDFQVKEDVFLVLEAEGGVFRWKRHDKECDIVSGVRVDIGAMAADVHRDLIPRAGFRPPEEDIMFKEMGQPRNVRVFVFGPGIDRGRDVDQRQARSLEKKDPEAVVQDEIL